MLLRSRLRSTSVVTRVYILRDVAVVVHKRNKNVNKRATREGYVNKRGEIITLPPS